MNDQSASLAFAALGHPHRVAVLRLLVRAGSQGTNIKSMRETLDIAASTFAHHLRMMSDAGLIDQEKLGREQIVRANYTAIQGLSTFLMEDCCADVFKGNCCP